MDRIERKILCIFGPSRQLWSISVIYEKLFQELGQCPAQGIGLSQHLFTVYLQNRPLFQILNQSFVKTTITDEQHKILTQELKNEEDARKVLKEIVSKKLTNTSENSAIVSYLHNEGDPRRKMVLIFNLQSFSPSVNQEIQNLITEKEFSEFKIVLNGFHLKYFIEDFNLDLVLKNVIKYILQKEGKLYLIQFCILHNFLLSEECELPKLTKYWLKYYGVNFLMHIIKLFPQVFTVSRKAIELKKSPVKLPSDGRLCLEVLRIQSSAPKTIEDIFQSLPKFCKTRIKSCEDLNHLFERHPDFLNPLLIPEEISATPPRILSPYYGTDRRWKHIKDELTSLSSVISIMNEDSGDELKAFTKRLTNLSEQAEIFCLSKCEQIELLKDLVPNDENIEDLSIFDI